MDGIIKYLLTRPPPCYFGIRSLFTSRVPPTWFLSSYLVVALRFFWCFFFLLRSLGLGLLELRFQQVTIFMTTPENYPHFTFFSTLNHGLSWALLTAGGSLNCDLRVQNTSSVSSFLRVSLPLVKVLFRDVSHSAAFLAHTA